jgi:signal peptidase I
MTDERSENPIRSRGTWSWWKLVMIAMIGACLLVGAARASGLRVYLVPSASMAPTLATGDRICVARYAGAPRRGQVWTYRATMAPGRPSAVFVKRVVGLPGETVEIKPGQMLVNGRPLSEPYLTTPGTYRMPPVTLGPNEYFVLGDNRNNSNDSHVNGPLPGRDLLGRAEARVWPPGRFGGL